MPEIIGSTGNQAISAKIIYTLTQSVQNNTSTIAATLYVRRLNDGYTSYGSTRVTLSIGGSSQTSWCYFNIGQDGSTDWQALLSYTQTISHNTDGTHAAVTISSTSTGSGTTIDPITVSGSVALPTIARASQPSCPASSTFGSTILIATNRASSSFTHTLVISMAAGSGGTAQSTTITGVEAARNFQIPTSWAAAIPKGVSANLVVTCTTFNGSTQIGSAKTCSCSVSVPASWVPSVSLAASVYNGFNGLYLQGRSAVNLTASNGVATTGSTIQSYAFSGPGISKTITTTSASPAAQRTSTLTAAGTMTYKVVITDARGRTGSATVSITCTAYTAPTITMQVTRCDSDGTANDYGEYAKAIVTGTLTTVTGNSATIDVGYKVLGDENYTGLNSWANLTAATNTKTSDVFAAASTNQYEIRATITDAVGRSAYVVLNISTAYAIMDVYKDEVVAFGAQAGSNSPGSGHRVHMAIPFADDEIYAQNNDGYGWGRLFNDNYSGFGLRAASLEGKAEGYIPDGTDVNTLTRPGTYFISSNAHAATMTNLPIQKAGVLFTISGTGGMSDSAWQYRRQVFLVSLSGDDIQTRYERYGGTNSGTTFTWTAWKTVTEIVDATITLGALTQRGTGFVVNNSAGTGGTVVRAKNAYGDVAVYTATNRGIYDYTITEWLLRRNYIDGVRTIRSDAYSMLLGTSFVSPYTHDTGWLTDPVMTWLKYRRVDNSIYLSFIGDGVSIATGAYRVMGKLPEQFRPTTSMYQQIFVANSNNLVLVNITTAGVVQMRNMSSNSTVTFRGLITYAGQKFKKNSDGTYVQATILSYNIGGWGDGTETYGNRMTTADYNAYIDSIKTLFNNIRQNVGIFTEWVTYMDKDLTHSARTEVFPSSTYAGYLDEDWPFRPAYIGRNAATQIERKVLVPGESGRQYLLASVSLGGYTIYVLGVHLDPTSATLRAKEMKAALDLMDTLETVDNVQQYKYQNVIICGDFNFAPDNNEYRTQFNTAKARGYEMVNGDFLPWTTTWSTKFPETKDTWYVDNILCRGRVKIVGADIPKHRTDDIMTDHYPVIAYVGIIGE